MACILVDLDGTLIKYDRKNTGRQHLGNVKLLPGVRQALQNWDQAGHKIVIVTGRRESTRKATEKQLEEAGITFDALVMGIGSGERILINDMKPDSPAPTARAYCVKRNEGLKNHETI